MAVCYIVSRAIVLQGGWPLFYIEWGWCWWTIIILISTTLWRLVCSFSHCWHSYLRLSDNVLRHRKTTPELWRAKEWWFYKFQFTSRSTHLVGGCSFCILNIAYPAAGCKGDIRSYTALAGYRPLWPRSDPVKPDQVIYPFRHIHLYEWISHKKNNENLVICVLSEESEPGHQDSHKKDMSQDHQKHDKK